jgi:hypothetical protein
MKLENWSITTEQDPYLAPELKRNYLQGNVYGNSNWPDG